MVKLYPQVNRQKGTLKVEVGIPEPDEWLRPDTSVRIVFFDDAKPASDAPGVALVTAPKSAIRGGDGGSFVWVVTQGRLRRQPITTGRELGDQVVVSDGLLGGEALVVGDPGAELADGDRVEVSPPAASQRLLPCGRERGDPEPTGRARESAPRGRYLAALSLGALGVVYGDIGTSPLYALRECFHGAHGVEPDARATCSACSR